MIKRFLSENYVCLIVLPAVFLLSCFNINDFDTWTHLAFGKQLVENASFISREVFIYPNLSAPIENPSWLFQIPLYLSYKAGGLAGVIIFKALTAALIFFFFVLLLRELGAGKMYTTIFSLLTALLVRFRLVERPELFAYLFFIIFLLVLSRAGRKKTKLVYLLPFIMIAWVNSHQSASIGIVLVIVFGAGMVIDKYILKNYKAEEGYHNIIHWFFFVFMITTGYLINPYALKNIASPSSLATNLQITQSVSEMQSVAFDPAYLMAYLTVLIAGIAVILMNNRKIPAAWIILFGIFSYASFKVVRSLPLFFFTGMSVMVLGFGPAADLKTKFRKTVHAGIIVMLGISVAFSGIYGKYRFGLDEERRLFPSGAVSFLKENNLNNMRIFNYMGWGGYISFNLGPGRTFIDGRYVNGSLSDDYDHIMAASEKWKGLIEKYRIDLIMINSIGFTDGRIYPLIEALMSEETWMPVYADFASLVFVNKEKAGFLREIPRDMVLKEMLAEAAFMYSIGIRGEMEKTLGKLYLKKNDYNNAKYYYGKWIKQNPSDKSARDVYEILVNSGY